MEPIAIIGMGCRFPGASNPEAFWQLLRNGEEAIAPVPHQRWDSHAFYDPNPDTPGKMNTCQGGFLEAVDWFDADFFGISPDEVEHTDPQQRLFLEVAWEALENAAIAPTSLAGSQTGVFIGLCTVDYHRLLYKDFACIGPYSGVGTTPSVTANRLSYRLNLCGPSMAVDTACSSSLVSVHLACQSLRSQETNLCLAGGVNLILSPDSTISSSQTGMLSGSGRCKTFDAGADGYVRGEGCGVIVLKRLKDAVKDKDSILALIRGSAVNHNGVSNNLSAPNGLAQQAVIGQALKNGNVHPSEIGYVDAHAVGTSLGDAIEFKALKTVLMQGRSPNHPCWIGSVKPNIGHLEAAAGISALIKVVLSLQHEEIPPHLNLQQLNPYISLENTPFSIPTVAQKWTKEQKRFAGVSAFGFGGTNAHVVLAAPLKIKTQTQERPYQILTLSAKSEAALRELAQRYEAFLEQQPEASLADVCYTANTGRTQFNHRLSIITQSTAQLRQQLQSFIANKKAAGLLQGHLKGRKRPKIAFLFPGEESELGLGYHLYKTQPTFRTAFDCCAEILNPYLEKPLLEVLYSEVEQWELFRNRISSPMPFQPTLFALEYALAKLWQSWGIKPQAVIGYGVGEYVAATVAGVFKLEDALWLVAQRTRLMQSSLADRTRVEKFAEIAAGKTYLQPRIPVSSLTEKLATAQIATPEYWCRHLQHSGLTDRIEISNDQLVLTMGSEASISSAALILPSLQGQDWLGILHTLSNLYVRGIDIDWSSFDRHDSRRRLQLPTYPFQRQRYWFNPKNECDRLSPSKSDKQLCN